MNLRFYRPQHFTLEELVDPDTFRERGERAWWLLDPRALITGDQLRERFGACIINDWHDGGNYHLSGFRPANCTTGAELSQHKFGRAFDGKFQTPAEEIRQYILAHPDEFPYLTALEGRVNWVHWDVRNHGGEGITVFMP